MGHNLTFALEKKYLYPIWRIQEGGKKCIPSQNEVLTTLDLTWSGVDILRNVENIMGGGGI
jgi:hypothetical protein